MPYARELERKAHESRARKSVQYGRVPERQWSKQNADAGGLRVRENTRFVDITNQVIIGIDDVMGVMGTGVE